MNKNSSIHTLPPFDLPSVPWTSDISALSLAKEKGKKRPFAPGTTTAVSQAQGEIEFIWGLPGPDLAQ